ncbi:MAG TPA: molybdopterin-dependent oxidoreductase [Acidocella sp.]|uniref:molybdopterin-dependent oxidoreductase n=1 Tax=Acidocella sp. TaxID=50710 RepID=UPI002C6205D7|nr:molybdopterin-dependent oxidoreductase [Acidocella sp.]HVE21330.1 molybdopterin-dependent oxidoreductase [Acidocella sp.]
MSARRNRPAVGIAEIRPELERLRRRGFLRNALSLGGLTLLTGCDLATHSGVDAALEAIMRFDDRVQAALFSRQRLAATYEASAITRPYRFNAFYAEWQVRPVPDNWALAVSGQVADRRPWTLPALMALPQQGQITRHICIEGWSQIGQWSGVPLHVFLRRVGADLRARYVSFTCFDGYSTSLDMESALHPQTLLALDFVNQPLAPQWGAPLRLRIPTKLGFKSAKNLQAIEVTNKDPGGYWENQGYDQFAGV